MVEYSLIEHVLEGCQCEGKRCTKCEEVKCDGLFNKQKIGAGGLHAACKACSSAINKAHFQKNRERIIAKHVAWRDSHPDYHKQYYREHADMLNMQSRDYQREHADEISKQKKIYYREHVEEIQEFRKDYQKPIQNIYAGIARTAIKSSRNNSKSRKESTIKRDKRRFVRGEDFIEKLIQKSTLLLIRLTFQDGVLVKLKQEDHILRNNGEILKCNTAMPAFVVVDKSLRSN